MRLRISVFFAIIMMASVVGCGHYTDVEIEQIVQKGDIIVEALKEYKEDKGDYPEELGMLVPSYLSEIPLLSTKSEQPFDYYKIPDEKADKYYYGYRLLHVEDRFVVIGAKAGRRLFYLPSEKYPRREFEKTHKVVNGWAYQTKSRQYGKPNKIVDE